MFYSRPYGDLFYSANYLRFVQYFYKTLNFLGLSNFCWDGEAAKPDDLFKVCKSRQIEGITFVELSGVEKRLDGHSTLS